VKYRPRIVDAEFEELLAGLPDVSIECMKAIGNVETALRRASTMHGLDYPGSSTGSVPRRRV